MTLEEKIEQIDLLFAAISTAESQCRIQNCKSCPARIYGKKCKAAIMTDYIAAQGVTMQQELKVELKFTRQFIHDNGLEFALAAAWEREKKKGGE